jgi:hypothetical protein
MKKTSEKYFFFETLTTFLICEEKFFLKLNVKAPVAHHIICIKKINNIFKYTAKQEVLIEI